MTMVVLNGRVIVTQGQFMCLDRKQAQILICRVQPNIPENQLESRIVLLLMAKVTIVMISLIYQHILITLWKIMMSYLI